MQTQLFSVRIYTGQDKYLPALFAADNIDEAHDKVRRWLTYPVPLKFTQEGDLFSIAICEGREFELGRSRIYL